MSETQILVEFKQGVISFLDELISQFTEDADLVIFRLFISNQIPIKDVIDTFIYKLNKDGQLIRKMIKNRDELFFLEKNIFDIAGTTDKVAKFKKIWRSERLDNDDKQTIWKWIDSFVYITDKYTKSLQKSKK